MAIRLLLVASVFALSLPLPDRQSPIEIYQLVNSELSEMLSTVRNEPIFEAVASISSPLADSSREIKDAALALPLAETPSPVALFPANEVELLKPAAEVSQAKPDKKVESPIDLAFDVIQDQFANEAAAFSIDEAAHHVSKIAVAEPAISLPPAPPADDLKEHQADIHLAEISKTSAVEGPKGSWAEVELIDADAPETILANLEIATVAGAEISDEEWRAYTALVPEPSDDFEIAMAQPAEAAPEEKPELRKALRLTLEAIAAWSNLAGKSVK